MIEYREDISVELIEQAGDDRSIVQAMLVSTGKDQTSNNLHNDEIYGKINYLMAHRHGTPFEHNYIKVRVEAPIFVFREWHRHRIGFSYNEFSARYATLPPQFYIPPEHRPMVPVKEMHYCNKISCMGDDNRQPIELNKESAGYKRCPYCHTQFRYHHPARPYYLPESKLEYDNLVEAFKTNYEDAYELYENLIKKDIAKEVARAILPVGIYSYCYVTCNARSLMAFLSLRTHDDNAKYVSYPQWEIEQAACQMEDIFQKQFPLTHKSFCTNGRVGP